MDSRKDNARQLNQQGHLEQRARSYLKPQVEKKATTSLKESVANKYTNVAFSVTGHLQRWKSFFTSDNSKQHEGYSYILGKKIASKSEAAQEFQRLIWFSYRKIPGMTKDIHSDTSWGCLIRVGQMAMASALKRHLALKTKFSEQTINSNIIPAFLDQDSQTCKYSLTKIVKEANKRHGLDYGEWFTVSQICSTLDIMHRHNPMRGTEDLYTIYYLYSQIFVEDIVGLLGERMCECKKPRIACPYCCGSPQKQEEKSPISSTTFGEKTRDFPKSEIRRFSRKPEPEERMRSELRSQIREPKNKPHALIFVSCQLGCSRPVSQSKFKQLQELLSLECSHGMIGGIPRKGLYFVGYSESDHKLMYLDPHYVQEMVRLDNLQEMMKTFFCEDMRKCSREEMDPSVGLVFFIEGLKQLEELMEKCLELEEKYEDYILSVGWKNELRLREGERMPQINDLEWEGDDGELENSFLGD